MIEQLTVFIQNEKGRLSGLCRTLADANINMHDLFIADTSDFGVVRVFCDTPQAAAKVLDEAGLPCERYQGARRARSQRAGRFGPLARDHRIDGRQYRIRLLLFAWRGHGH